MKFFAAGFTCLILLCITVSVISEEIRPRSHEFHHHHLGNGRPGCWRIGPGYGPRTGPTSPSPPEDGPSDVPDDGDGGDDKLNGDDEDNAIIDEGFAVKEGDGDMERLEEPELVAQAIFPTK